MKRRLMCLFLGMILLLSMLLVGCSGSDASEEDIANATMRTTQTLVVYLMSEKEVDKHTEYAIEDEINKLTKSKFKTQLDLRFFTDFQSEAEDKEEYEKEMNEKNYYRVVEAKLKAKEKEIKAAEKAAKDKKKYEKWLRESCKQAGVSYVPATTKKVVTEATEEETLVNAEYGIIEYKYPEPETNQIDIFYVGGYDRYMSYIDEDWLARLNDEISTSSKKLEEHIPYIYMENIKEDGIYGIPTNSAIGTYTWMLLNKELMDDYFYPESEVDYLLNSGGNTMDEDLYNFLNDVNTYERENYVPIKGKSLDPVNVFYWSIDPETLRFTNSESVFGAVYTPENRVGDPVKGVNLFGDAKYVNQLKMIKRFEFAGFFEEEGEEDKPFAMQVIEGGYEIYEQYSDEYYIKMIECPRAGEDNVYSDMLCVNMLEDNISRTMEVLTFINTKSEPRNILQYGIEGENYYIESGVLHRFNYSYMMDVKKTGNVFMAHPEEGLPADYWSQWVQQNEDAKAYPTFGFRVGWSSNLDVDKLVNLQNLYVGYEQRLDACTNIDEVNAFFSQAALELSENEDLKFSKEENYIPEAGHENDPMPLMKIYIDWLKNEHNYGGS
ncbi:MAG: hypothetical protein E7641_06500 [Ruminococcaceae bacterium]|nr:hypothetical protein [Oscillospiraceae bacterium]